MAFGYIYNYSDDLQNIIQSHKTDHTYVGKGNSVNYYSHFMFPKNKIKNPLIILTGLEDPIPSWFQVVHNAKKYGFRSVYIVELRGQGMSERVLGKQSRLIYVENFEDYVEDFVSFLSHVSHLKSKASERPYYISHSTGSTVVGNALEMIKDSYPEMYPIKMSFWTPLVKLKIPSIFKYRVVQSLVSFIDRLTLFFNYPIVVRKFRPTEFKDNHITSSMSQHELAQNLRFKDGFGSEGISLHWVLEAVEGTAEFRKKLSGSIQVPTLLLKAENEQIVDNSYDIKNRNIEIRWVSMAQHALNIEKETTRNKVSQMTFDFFIKN